MVTHVQYEHSHLWIPYAHPLPAWIATGNVDRDALTNGLLAQWRLESTLTHLRVMIGFLTGTRNTNYPLGLVADDFFDVGWPNRPQFVIGKGPSQQKDILDDLNGRLAHLSLRRLQDATPVSGFSWAHVIELMSPAKRIFVEFDRFRDDLAAAHPDRGRWFTDDMFQRAASFPDPGS
jgi:hypothetical protein